MGLWGPLWMSKNQWVTGAIKLLIGVITITQLITGRGPHGRSQGWKKNVEADLNPHLKMLIVRLLHQHTFITHKNGDAAGPRGFWEIWPLKSGWNCELTLSNSQWHYFPWSPSKVSLQNSSPNKTCHWNPSVLKPENKAHHFNYQSEKTMAIAKPFFWMI